MNTHIRQAVFMHLECNLQLPSIDNPCMKVVSKLKLPTHIFRLLCAVLKTIHFSAITLMHDKLILIVYHHYQ